MTIPRLQLKSGYIVCHVGYFLLYLIEIPATVSASRTAANTPESELPVVRFSLLDVVSTGFSSLDTVPAVFSS